MLKRKFVSIYIWSISAVVTIILYLMTVLVVALFPFDKKRKRAHAQCYWWSDAIIASNPFWKVEASGLENIDHNKTYVIVANHQSMADIVVLYKTRMQFKWVAKDSLFEVPFVGWCMSLCKHIRISRGEISSIKNVYRDAIGWLSNDMSVLFFPEGTRSETGRMKEFQNGAFKLAIKERAPILPIRLEGTRNAITKGSWVFNVAAKSSVKVLPAVETAGYQNSEFARLRDTVRSMLESA